MPLGSSKLGFFGEAPQGQGVLPHPSPVSNITPNSFTITGNNAVLLNVASTDGALFNTNVVIRAVGTNANVFTDNESSTTVTLNGSGAGSLLKRINGNITSSANVQFTLENSSGAVLFTTANISISGFPWVAGSGGTVVKSNGMVYHYLTTNSDTFTITNVQNTANIHALVVGGGGHGGGWDHTYDSTAVQQIEPFGGNSNVVLNDAALAGGGGGGQMYHLKDISLTSANVSEQATVSIGVGGSNTTTNSRGGNTSATANFHASVTAIGGGGGASGSYYTSTFPTEPGFPAGGRTIGNPINTNGDVAADTVLCGTGGGGASLSMGISPSIGDRLSGESADTYPVVNGATFYSNRLGLVGNPSGFIKADSVTMANTLTRQSSTTGQGGPGGVNMQGFPGGRDTIPGLRQGPAGTLYGQIVGKVPGDPNNTNSYSIGFPIEYYDYYNNVFDIDEASQPEWWNTGVWGNEFGKGGDAGTNVSITTPADTTSGYGAGGSANYPGKSGVVVYCYQDSTYTGDWVVNK
jgi:hypothetical protein